MSLSANKTTWLAAVVAAGLIAALLWFLLASKPFLLVVLFEDTGGLERGDPVLWKGFTIGRVEKVEPLVDNRIGVTIRLREDYGNRITHGSEFRLRRASLLGLAGTNAVEVVTPDSPGAPFASGEKVQGISNPGRSLLDKGGQAAAEFWQYLREESGRLAEEFRNSPYREQASEALKELGSLVEKGARQVKEGAEQFRKEHQEEIDRLLRKLEDLKTKEGAGGNLPAEKEPAIPKNPPARP